MCCAVSFALLNTLNRFLNWLVQLGHNILTNSCHKQVVSYVFKMDNWVSSQNGCNAENKTHFVALVCTSKPSVLNQLLRVAEICSEYTGCHFKSHCLYDDCNYIVSLNAQNITVRAVCLKKKLVAKPHFLDALDYLGRHVPPFCCLFDFV